MKTVTIPVVIRALELIKTSIENYIGNPDLGWIQKIVFTGTAYILRKTLSM